MKRLITLIAALMVAMIVFQQFGVEAKTKMSKRITAFERIRRNTRFGSLKQLPQTESNRRFHTKNYKDNKFEYSVKEDGNVVSLLRLQEDRNELHTGWGSKRRSYTKKQAAAWAKKGLVEFLPEYAQENYKVETDEDLTNYQLVRFKRINAYGVFFSSIDVRVDEVGNVMSIMSDAKDIEEFDNVIPKYSKEDIIAIAELKIMIVEGIKLVPAEEPVCYYDDGKLVWGIQMKKKSTAEKYFVRIDEENGDMISFSASK